MRRLFDPDLLLRPTVLALWVALGSVVVKEALYHYTMRSARRLRDYPTSMRWLLSWWPQ